MPRLERCQFENSLYRYVWPLGMARLLKFVYLRLSEARSEPVGLGEPSRFGEGDWVRVKDADAIKATLDAKNRHRGLWFTDTQWSYCSKTFQVDRVVQRMMDDERRMRKISRTTTLAGATCAGADLTSGCGRACALLFRDDWLEPSSPEAAEPVSFEGYARVKPMDEIRKTLGRGARLDGIGLAPEMERFAGGRYGVVTEVREANVPSWKHQRGEWYVLHGARCRGKALEGAGPCHRQCGLLWHRSWLDFEAPETLEHVDASSLRSAPRST
jgi:hypothetical protein